MSNASLSRNAMLFLTITNIALQPRYDEDLLKILLGNYGLARFDMVAKSLAKAQ